MTPPMRQALSGVDVLPPGEAYDYDFFCARLGSHELLTRSVALRVYRMPLFAVPVGRTRRGGFFVLDDRAAAPAVCAALAPLNGFPDFRTVWVAAPIAAYAVEWGDRPPRPHGRARTSDWPSTTSCRPVPAAFRPPLRQSPAVPLRLSKPPKRAQPSRLERPSGGPDVMGRAAGRFSTPLCTHVSHRTMSQQPSARGRREGKPT